MRVKDTVQYSEVVLCEPPQAAMEAVRRLSHPCRDVGEDLPRSVAGRENQRHMPFLTITYIEAPVQLTLFRAGHSGARDLSTVRGGPVLEVVHLCSYRWVKSPSTVDRAVWLLMAAFEGASILYTRQALMADFPICEQVVDFFLLGDSPRLTLADLAWTSSEKHRVSQLHQLRFAFVIKVLDCRGCSAVTDPSHLARSAEVEVACLRDCDESALGPLQSLAGISASERAHQSLLPTETYRISGNKGLQLLDALAYDPLALALCSLSGRASFAVAAVSPSARLYSELLFGAIGNSNPTVDLSGNRVFHTVEYGRVPYDLRQVLYFSGWWLKKSALPLKAKGASAMYTLLAAPADVSSRVEAVELGLKEYYALNPYALQPERVDARVTGEIDNALCTALASPTLHLCSLHVGGCSNTTLQLIWKLPQLTDLSINGMHGAQLSMDRLACACRLKSLSLVGAQFEQLAFFEVCRALVDVNLVYCRDLRSLGPLARAAQLRYLTVSNSDVENIDGLDECVSLESVRFIECERLTSLAPLAGAPRLRTLSATRCALRDIHGLHTCPHLESADFSCCAELLSLAPLSGSPRLKTINAAWSGVEDIQGLHLCPQLETVDFTELKQLRSLTALSGAVRLRVINAMLSGTETVDGLNRCLQLESVNLTDSRRLTSLAPLAGAPRLRILNARGCPVTLIDGLGTCPQLEHVSFQCAKGLTSLLPLAGAAQLRVVDASWTGLQSVDGLDRCSRLECVDFTGCRGVVSLAPLSGSPRLRVIKASESAVNNVDGLNTCPQLERLHVNRCTRLASLAPLAGAPRLHSINACWSGLENVSGLNRCPRLVFLDVSHCRQLRSLAPLSGSPSLRRIEANHSALQHLDDVDISAKVHFDYVWIRLSRRGRNPATASHDDAPTMGGGSKPHMIPKGPITGCA
ncbi:hypothetical protein CGC21_28975 [Leishmania donovani]|uniref:Leucine Rich repeat family protein n=1 Tax=Leishmania donovani TaxID=5661 RepID=A0A504Y3T3_LEIDO|nr:hypothetical protein CGC21_28975 [Leishmania donovani]